MDERYVIGKILQRGRLLHVEGDGIRDFQHSANLYLELDIEVDSTNPFVGTALSAPCSYRDDTVVCPVIVQDDGKHYILLREEVFANAGEVNLSIGGINENKVVVTSNTIKFMISDSGSIKAEGTPPEIYWEIEVLNAMKVWYANSVDKPLTEILKQLDQMIATAKKQLEDTGAIITTAQQHQAEVNDLITTAHEQHSAVDKAISDAEDATKEADAAAVNAIEKATLANDAAAKADTSSKNADNAARLAETNASTANTAAVNANEKATLASEAADKAKNAASTADEKANLANAATETANTAAETAITAAANADNKAALANDAAANADTAAANADSKAKSAETSALAANTAAASANEKAGLADNAANEATAAATNANEKADIANAAAEKAGTAAQTATAAATNANEKAEQAENAKEAAEAITSEVQRKLDAGEFVGPIGKTGPVGPPGDAMALAFVQELPATGERSTLYFVPNGGTGNNSFDEFMWIKDAWEKIGSTEIDLSGYLPLTGGTVTGDMTIIGDMTLGKFSEFKILYREGWMNVFSNVDGTLTYGDITGGLELRCAIPPKWFDGNKKYPIATEEFANNKFLPLSGGALNGEVSIANNKSFVGVSTEGNKFNLIALNEYNNVFIGAKQLPVLINSSIVPVWNNGSVTKNLATEEYVNSATGDKVTDILENTYNITRDLSAFSMTIGYVDTELNFGASKLPVITLPQGSGFKHETIATQEYISGGMQSLNILNKGSFKINEKVVATYDSSQTSTGISIGDGSVKLTINSKYTPQVSINGAAKKNIATEYFVTNRTTTLTDTFSLSTRYSSHSSIWPLPDGWSAENCAIISIMYSINNGNTYCADNRYLPGANAMLWMTQMGDVFDNSAGGMVSNRMKLEFVHDSVAAENYKVKIVLQSLL